MRRAVLVAAMVFLSSQASAITIGPAPEGEATIIAQQIIQKNFDQSDCPLVVAATRLGDGSIKAICNNEESFRVFSVEGVGAVALKCSAAQDVGISGC